MAADDANIVDMDMSFLRDCATTHDPFVEKGEEIAAALDALAEEDAAHFQCFLQARFKVFFDEEVKPQMKAMMSVKRWQCIYTQKECLVAIRCYNFWKNIWRS